MYVLFCTFHQTLPSGPPCLEQEGHRLQACHETRVFEIPVKESLVHSFSVGFTNAFITSPLQVLYTRHSGGAYHRALQTSWRGWADSKAVHSMECGGACSLYWRTLSVGAAACSALYCQCWKGVLPNLELSHKEPKQQTDPRSCARVVYIAGDTLRHQPMGAGYMTVLQFCGPMAFCVLQWCHPMLARTYRRTSCSTRMITLYGARKRIQAPAHAP